MRYFCNVAVLLPMKRSREGVEEVEGGSIIPSVNLIPMESFPLLAFLLCEKIIVKKFYASEY